MRCILRDINRTAHIFVKVGAANTAPGDLNLKLSREVDRAGSGHILNANILPAMPDRSFHKQHHPHRMLFPGNLRGL